MKRTKIVCTLGPASEKKTTIKKMIKAGMNVARLNFSHGTYENHAQLIKNIRSAAKELETTVTILQDLQGPKIRFSEMRKDIEIRSGEKILLIPEGKSTAISKTVLSVGFVDLYKYVEKGDRLFFDDGLMEAIVEKVSNTFIHAKVKNGGVIKSHKGINLPDSVKTIESLTEKDKQDLQFGIEHGVDFVALSFVQTAEDVQYLRELISKYEAALIQKPKTATRIIVKIEKKQAINHFPEILSKTDAVMVARGDLAIETRFQDVPLYQKEIIERCLHAGKPVIVATQMLDSMTHNPRPTRAEVSDVANAVIDHVDAVMLSQESATGEYPVETVKTMRDVITNTEESPYDDLIEEELRETHFSLDVALSMSAVRLLKDFEADAILVVSSSQMPARIIASHRPEVPILVAVESEREMRQLNVSWGVIPILIPASLKESDAIEVALKSARKSKIIKKKQKVVVVGSDADTADANVNIIKIDSV